MAKNQEPQQLRETGSEKFLQNEQLHLYSGAKQSAIEGKKQSDFYQKDELLKKMGVGSQDVKKSGLIQEVQPDHHSSQQLL
ncbi:hypothetical protein ACHAXS_007076 [Conticribra weissflogii]